MCRTRCTLHLRAGRGARKTYSAASKRWRKRVFRGPHVITALLVAAIVVLIIAVPGDGWIVVAGAGLGLLLGVYLTLLESPPGYIENWRTGAEGERRTARTLAPLRRRGYKLLHDLPDRRSPKFDSKSNLDHVVVSSAGVFLLDSKLLGGAVSIKGETVRVQRRDDEEESYDLWWLARTMRGRARRLQEDIEQATGIRSVLPVVVFWNEFSAGLVEREGLVFVWESAWHPGSSSCRSRLSHSKSPPWEHASRSSAHGRTGSGAADLAAARRDWLE